MDDAVPTTRWCPRPGTGGRDRFDHEADRRALVNGTLYTLDRAKRAHAVRRPADPPPRLHARPHAAAIVPAHRRARAEAPSGPATPNRYRRLQAQLEPLPRRPTDVAATREFTPGVAAGRALRALCRPSPRSTRSCAREAAVRRSELRPHAGEYEHDRWFPNAVFLRWRRRASSGSSTRGATAAPAATTCTTRCGPRSSRAAARAGSPPASARTSDRHAADLEVRHRGAEAALPRPRDPGREDRRPRDHRARRRLRRRRHQDLRAEASTAASSSTARRRSSPTACARTSSSPRSRRRRRAVTTGSRS